MKRSVMQHLSYDLFDPAGESIAVVVIGPTRVPDYRGNGASASGCRWGATDISVGV